MTGMPIASVSVDEIAKSFQWITITAPLAKEVLKKKPGATHLLTTSDPRSVKEFIRETVVGTECRVGHAFYQAADAQPGAIFAANSPDTTTSKTPSRGPEHFLPFLPSTSPAETGKSIPPRRGNQALLSFR